MDKSISILDKDYLQWVQELCKRYQRCQIKAAVKVNQEMLRFYWELGRDIIEMDIEKKWGEKVIRTLSADLKREIPNATGFSRTNLYYIRSFYCLYSELNAIVPQIEGQLSSHSKKSIVPPTWGTISLISSQSDGRRYLYERSGKAVTNFNCTLPAGDSDLAQEMTKDPYCFDFTGLRERYNERQLKDALIANLEKFLLELGTGFAYMGREFRLEIGGEEQFLDMLFYNIRLRCYVVIEVKTVAFQASHIGQLGAYVVAVDHLLRKESDNKTIGLLVCKTKNNVFAQYALESSNQPLGISEYELSKLYPEKVEGTIPSIEEIEAKLGE